jgi:hypothetical protein
MVLREWITGMGPVGFAALYPPYCSAAQFQQEFVDALYVG